MTDPTSRQFADVKSILIALVVIGAILRLWQYAGNTSLWGDEIALAQNILERPLGELLTAPLAYYQAAPKGFLLAEKLTVRLFGPSEYALRLFPLLCSLAALILFRRVAERVLDSVAAPVAVALFACFVPLIFFAAEVKQYSTDVLVAVLLLDIALDVENAVEVSWSRAVRAAVTGAASAWFSHPAVFLLVGLGSFFVVRASRSHKLSPAARCCIGIVAGAWILSAAGATAFEFATTSPQTREYMRRFWAHGMLPGHPLEAFSSSRWWKGALGDESGRAVAAIGRMLYAALMAAGVVLLWRRRRDVAVFILAPTGLTLAAAAARQYPFSGRLILFLVPGLVLAVAEGVEAARRRAAKLSPVCAAAALIALAGPPLYRITTAPPVYRMQDIKPPLAHLQANRRAGDAVYVYYRGGPSVFFYARAYGLGPNDYLSGGCYPGDARRYLEELDRFRGRSRVWLVVADVAPQRTTTDDLLAYMDAIGVRLDSFVVPTHSPNGLNIADTGVFLYDLSDANRSAKIVAGSFPMKTGNYSPAWLRCDEGPVTVDPARRASPLH